MSKGTERRDGWITTDFLDKSGGRVAGPFGSMSLAMQHRAFLHEREGHRAYSVCSEPLQANV